ncbi:MAG: 1-deoxy-D-xylulose-5-phosphate reductoisomerase [Campylobacteraceae bacterium]
MVILGSTGSIGVNALCIAKDYSLNVKALVANSNIELLNRQIKEFNPKYVAIGDENLKDKVEHKNVFVGESGILEMLELAFEKGITLVNALVGFAGLKPTIKAQKLGYRIALANKETLVVAGKFIDTSKIIPIDSEHFGLWYLKNDKKIAKMTITASGGALRDTPLEKIHNISVGEALNHPNWKMGKKITIDSATMMNKIFELLEARWLFDFKNIDAIIETKSVIHALIDFVDGSTTAHLANTDMKLPIAYAMLKEVNEPILKPINLLHVKSLEFREIDTKRYPIWVIKDFLLENPHFGVVVNAANEVAIKLFFEEKIAFGDIAAFSLNAIKKFEDIKVNSVEDIFLINDEVKNFCFKEMNVK